MRNSVKAVEMLLNHRTIDVNVQNCDGMTPLHVGVALRNVESVELLLKSEFINLALRDKQERTAMDLAEGSPAILNLFDRVSSFRSGPIVGPIF